MSNNDKKNLTFVLMDPPFETERTTTALRIVDAALRQGHSVNVFAYEGAVYLPFTRQQAHPNTVHGRSKDEENHPLPHQWVEQLMTTAQLHGGALKWINCGLCEDERGAGEAVTGVQRGSPAHLLQWIEASDNTMVIGTRG